MIDHPQIKELEYNEITDGIYIGTNQCCQTHFDERLKKEGITADISLEASRLDAPFGVDFYIWMSVQNHMAPKHDQLEFGVSVLEKLVSMGRKVYVHCKNGHGRAPTLVSAYIIKKGKTPAEAEALIKSKRPTMHLNNIQRQALFAFAKAMAGKEYFNKK